MAETEVPVIDFSNLHDDGGGFISLKENIDLTTEGDRWLAPTTPPRPTRLRAVWIGPAHERPPLPVDDPRHESLHFRARPGTPRDDPASVGSSTPIHSPRRASRGLFHRCRDAATGRTELPPIMIVVLAYGS